MVDDSRRRVTKFEEKKEKKEKKLEDFFNKTQEQKILGANLVNRYVWRVKK